MKYVIQTWIFFMSYVQNTSGSDLTVYIGSILTKREPNKCLILNIS